MHPALFSASNASQVMPSPSAGKAALNVSAMHMMTPNFAVQQTNMPLHVMVAPVHETLAVQPVQNVHMVNSALAFNNSVKAAADQASAQSVEAPSMSVALNYRLVGLSRAPWWSDILVGMTNWYVPGQHKDSWVGAASTQRCFGLPVSLILTANVQITASWSASDRAAAASNSHVGPWALAGAEIPAPDSSGKATLTIPSMQAIGCICRVMPSLPPVDDPAL